MTLQEIISYFKTGANACRAIGYNRSTFISWKKRGIIPFKAQQLFNKVTQGVLKVNRSEKFIYKQPVELFYLNANNELCKIKSITFYENSLPLIKYICNKTFKCEEINLTHNDKHRLIMQVEISND